MSSIWDEPLRTALEQIASAEPVPGGGSASALSGLIGLGLVRMAIKVTQASAEKNQVERLGDCEAALSKIGMALEQSVDSDMEAFSSYMAAIRMPKGTPELDEARNQALDRALNASLEVPFSAAERLRDALKLAQTIEPFVKASIVSDLLSGAEIMKSAATSLLFNIDVNAKSSRLRDRRHELIERKRSLLVEIQEISRLISTAGLGRGFVISQSV